MTDNNKKVNVSMASILSRLVQFRTVQSRRIAFLAARSFHLEASPPPTRCMLHVHEPMPARFKACEKQAFHLTGKVCNTVKSGGAILGHHDSLPTHTVLLLLTRQPAHLLLLLRLLLRHHCSPLPLRLIVSLPLSRPSLRILKGHALNVLLFVRLDHLHIARVAVVRQLGGVVEDALVADLGHAGLDLGWIGWSLLRLRLRLLLLDGGELLGGHL